MIKVIQALLIGLFFTFTLDFFLFLGLKLHYIDPLGIKVYYNTLFADNQNSYLFGLITFLSAILAYFVRSTGFFLTILTFITLSVMSVLIPSIGKEVGVRMFTIPNQQITIDPHVYRGDILYIDRKEIYFYDTDLQRMITLPKESYK